MALLSGLVCIAFCFTEPSVQEPRTVIGPVADVDDPIPASLFAPGSFLNELPADLEQAVETARQFRINQDIERRAKQLLVHLTSDRLRVFTANRPPQDQDLLDRVLSHEELVVICDGMDEDQLEGKTVWTFTGNVLLYASRLMIFCHEARIIRNEDDFVLRISGGPDFPNDRDFPEKFERQPTHAAGSAILAGGREADEPHSYSSATVFSSGKVRIKLHDGNYVVKMEQATKNPQRD